MGEDGSSRPRVEGSDPPDESSVEKVLRGPTSLGWKDGGGDRRDHSTGERRNSVSSSTPTERTLPFQTSAEQRDRQSRCSARPRVICNDLSSRGKPVCPVTPLRTAPTFSSDLRGQRRPSCRNRLSGPVVLFLRKGPTEPEERGSPSVPLYRSDPVCHSGPASVVGQGL